MGERKIPGGQFVRELPGASPMTNESGLQPPLKFSRSLQTPRNLPLSNFVEFGDSGVACHEQTPPHQRTHAAKHDAKLVDRDG